MLKHTCCVAMEFESCVHYACCWIKNVVIGFGITVYPDPLPLYRYQYNSMLCLFVCVGTTRCVVTCICYIMNTTRLEQYLLPILIVIPICHILSISNDISCHAGIDNMVRAPLKSEWYTLPTATIHLCNVPIISNFLLHRCNSIIHNYVKAQ